MILDPLSLSLSLFSLCSLCSLSLSLSLLEVTPPSTKTSVEKRREEEKGRRTTR